MHFLATCIAGAEKLVRQELMRQDIRVTGGQDRVVRFEGDIDTMLRANLWSRTANRIFIEMDHLSVTSFDTLFAAVEYLDWSRWIPDGSPLLVTATSIRSTLAHTPTIQSITHKALIRRLSGGSDTWREDTGRDPLHVHIILVADEAFILLDTTGPALHKRGYRSEAGEAPIKESLAATLTLLSQWKYSSPLYDPLCGSGTIPIEAAMIARNIAPGQHRRYDWMRFCDSYDDRWEKLVSHARTEVFDKQYAIFASDIDPEMIEIARANARRAGVLDTIDFSVADFRDVPYKHGGHIVTNPPYGKRLGLGEDMLYTDLENSIVTHDLTAGIITSVDDFPVNLSGWTHSNILNGDEKCRFWKKAHSA